MLIFYRIDAADVALGMPTGACRCAARTGEGKQHMEPASQPKSRGKRDIPRDERLERIRRLIAERGEDAASLVKTWLHADEGKAGRRK
jgi:flagellar biosynthesis/type III secretory pathway M-ring protein FliF/YscJ